MSDTSIYFSPLYFTRSSRLLFSGISHSWAFTIAFNAFSIDSLSVASDGLLACHFYWRNLSSLALISFFYINYIQSFYLTFSIKLFLEFIILIREDIGSYRYLLQANRHLSFSSSFCRFPHRFFGFPV